MAGYAAQGDEIVEHVVGGAAPVLDVVNVKAPELGSHSPAPPAPELVPFEDGLTQRRWQAGVSISHYGYSSEWVR